jgi:hypothetical protein
MATRGADVRPERHRQAGPAYTRPEWFAGHIDARGVLRSDERDAAGVEARDRVQVAYSADPNVDPYDLAWRAIAEVQRRHEVAYREPLPPDPEPVDLDLLCGVSPAGPTRRCE